MTVETFSQKEMLIALMKKLDETHDTLLKHMSQEESQLKAIHDQTLKTNGRVSRLEDEMDVVQMKTENLGVKVAAGVFIACAITAEVVRIMI